MSNIKLAAGKLASRLHCTFGDRCNDTAILAYHHTHPRLHGIPNAEFNVEPDNFKKQLAGLQEMGFKFVALSEVLDAHRDGRKLAPRSVVVTFDDCFESVYEYAFPILQDLSIPATLFLATSHLDMQGPFPFDPWGGRYRDRVPANFYRPISVAQCREMQSSGLIELGVHTHSHQDFRDRPGELYRDLRESMKRLAQTFGITRPSFAFPFGRKHLGYCGGAMTAAARLAGVRCALTTDCSTVNPTRDDPFEWGRFNSYNDDDSATLAAKCTGWYGWITKLQVSFDKLRGRARPAPSCLPRLAEQATATKVPA
jgi:peptidoglycan/xylan/chitin deacetylase (PgdA/CDA1 family)